MIDRAELLKRFSRQIAATDDPAVKAELAGYVQMLGTLATMEREQADIAEMVAEDSPVDTLFPELCLQTRRIVAETKALQDELVGCLDEGVSAAPRGRALMRRMAELAVRQEEILRPVLERFGLDEEAGPEPVSRPH